MVFLAVPEIGTPSGAEERSPHLPLRTTALWYPDIPPENLHLYESSFAGRDVPLSEYHPMRVLLLIPKAESPILEGGYSRDFKDFVAKCLVKNPSERPTGTNLDNVADGSPRVIKTSVH